MKGIVESIGTKEVKTRFGMKTTYSFKVGGEWYKMGFTKPMFGKGDAVEFEYTEGTYGREVDKGAISVVSKVSAGEPSIPPAGARSPFTPAYTGGKGVFPIPALDGQRAIVRQNALTNARELYITVVDINSSELGKAADGIISLARKFEAYACGDLDALRAKEMAEAKEVTVEDIIK